MCAHIADRCSYYQSSARAALSPSRTLLGRGAGLNPGLPPAQGKAYYSPPHLGSLASQDCVS